MAFLSLELQIVCESVIGWWSGYLQLDSFNSFMPLPVGNPRLVVCAIFPPLPFNIATVGGQGMCTPTYRDTAALRTGQDQRTVATGSFVALDPK